MNYKEQLQNLSQKFQKGGQKPYSEKSYDEVDIKDFYKKMVGSEWYKNRLIKNGYDDQYSIGAEGVVKKRMNRIDKAHVDNVQSDDGFNNQLYRFMTSGDLVKTGTGAYYNHDEDEITLVKSQMDRLKAHPRSILAHEFGHAETGQSISNVEQEMLGKLRPEDGLTPHNKSPFENKSDINALRYNLYKNNLYDPSTGKFKTKSGLFESKLLKPVNTDFSTKRLREHYGDNYLETLMNTIAENSNNDEEVQYAQQGGQTQEDWKQKYSTNPYFKDREDWGDKLSNKFPNAKNTVKDSIYAVAKQSGVDPGILYTSSMEEGMKLALTGKDTFERREGYNQFRQNNPKGAQEYPIDGGYFYGLNTFGDKYGKVIKPSSLPQGFKYAPYEQKDAQGNKLYTSAAFRSHDDAIAAKAAMMKQVESAMTARLQKNGLNLTPEARKFFDMVGYNMGEDKTIEMIKSYQQKGYLKNDQFLDPNFQPASWKEPYTNVQRRYQNYKILNDQGYFNDYAQPAPDNGQQTVIGNKQVGGTIDTSSLKNQLNGLAQKFQTGGCVECEQQKMQKGGIYDELSFKDAFKKAMSEGNEGENFEWRGNQYKREYASPQKPSITTEQNIDDLSFGDAFQREIANKNGRESFKWRGKDYSLSYKEDEKIVPRVTLPQREQPVSVQQPVQQKAQNEIEEVVLKKSPNLPNPFLNQKDQTQIYKPVELDKKYYSSALDLEAIKKSNESIRENEKVKNVVISRDDKGQEIIDKNGNLEYVIKSPDYVKEFNNHIQNINKNLQNPNVQEEVPVGLSKLNFLQQNYNGDTAFVQNNGVWERVTNNVQGDVNNILTYEKERGKGNNFVIIDKKNQKLSIYDKQGNRLEDTEVMLGKNKWDSVAMLYNGKEGKHVDYGTGNSSTGAGIFSIGDIEEEAKHYLTKEPLYMLRDEEGNYTNQAMHAPATQGRADRLNNGDMDDNRVTFGCVAGKCGFMKNIHRKRLLNQGDRVYITPEEEGNRMEYKNGELKTIMSQENIDEYAEYGDGYGITRKGRGNYSKEKKPRTVLDIFQNKKS